MVLGLMFREGFWWVLFKVLFRGLWGLFFFTLLNIGKISLFRTVLLFFWGLYVWGFVEICVKYGVGGLVFKRVVLEGKPNQVILN